MYETRTRNKCDNHLQNDFEIYKAIDYFCFVCILDWKLHSAINLIVSELVVVIVIMTKLTLLTAKSRDFLDIFVGHFWAINRHK